MIFSFIHDVGVQHESLFSTGESPELLSHLGFRRKQGSRKKRIHGWRNFRRRQQNISSVTKYQQRCSNNMSCATLNVETGLNSMTLPFQSRHEDTSHLISGSFYSAQLEIGCKLCEAGGAQNRYIWSTTRSILKHLD